MKWKNLILFLVIALLMGLSACGNEKKTKGVDGNPNVDLSIYTKHGNWSCGRIWVEKTEKSWDNFNTYVGYLDEEGNLIGEWHDESTWELPSDFENGFAFIGTGKREYSWNSSTIVSYDVIDLDGDVVFSIECIAGRDGYEDAAVEQFSNNGYAFYIEGYYEDTYVRSGRAYMLCENGNKISLDERLNLNSARLSGFSGAFSEGYMAFLNEAYINESGKVVLDFSDCLEGYLGQKYIITNLYPIEDGVAKIVFKGRDDEKYFIVVDTYGNLLTPKPISFNNFSNFDFDSLERYDNSRVSSLKQSDIICGATVKLGNYEQDNITANGSELIEWLVIHVDDNKALLISKYVLDACAYEDDIKYSETVNWENSYVRKWLNNRFYHIAFSDDEKQYLADTEIESKLVTYIGAYDGENLKEDIVSRNVESIPTIDKVFLLSVDEIDEFMSASEKEGIATKYSSESVDHAWYNGISSEPNYKWMSRDLVAHKSYSGIYTKQVLAFEGNGVGIYNYDNWDEIYDYDVNGVRPAIYIDLTKIN